MIFLLRSFISDTYFTSIKTVAFIFIVTAATIMPISDVAYSSKHFLILPLLIYIFHVIILVLDIIKASKSFVLSVYLYDFHPFLFYGELR